MTDEVPTPFELEVAKISVSSFFDVLLAAPPACRGEILGMEMAIQGMAIMRRVDAEVVRGEIAESIRRGLGLDAAVLSGMTPRGTA